MLNKKTKLKISSYNLEPKNSSFKKISYVIILLVILPSIAGFVYYSKPSPKEEPKKEISVAEEKSKILSRLNTHTLDNKPLSKEEKDEIYNKISGTKIQDFNFSNEEKLKLLDVLNN